MIRVIRVVRDFNVFQIGKAIMDFKAGKLLRQLAQTPNNSCALKVIIIGLN